MTDTPSLFESIRQINSLKDDVDEPIRSVVAMLALLGCAPAWSCCGFDYEGQPHHKSHTHGYCYFVMSQDAMPMVESIMSSLPYQHNMANRWRLCKQTRYGKAACGLSSVFSNSTNAWNSSGSVHFSEPGVIAIGLLEESLYKLSDQFVDKVVLVDTNKEYKNTFPAWVYPARGDWIIHGSDFAR